jgi:hypothetical protein
MDITARDQTEDMDFTGETTRWWLAKQASTPSAVSLVPPEELGVKTTTNKAILIEELLADVDVPISPTAAGMYIPDREILKRSKYQWFARLSPKQVLESNTLIGKYILLGVRLGLRLGLRPHTTQGDNLRQDVAPGVAPGVAPPHDARR